MTWHDVASELAELLRAETESPLADATVELYPRLQVPTGLTVYVMPPARDDPINIVSIGGETVREFGIAVHIEAPWDDDSTTGQRVMNAASQVVDIVEANRTLPATGARRGTAQAVGYRFVRRPAREAYTGFAVIVTIRYRSE